VALRGGGLIMALRYWVGGTATWDGTAGSKWSLTSGGVGGQAVPTSADDVIFNNASGINTVTIATGAICGTLSTTGFRGTVAFGTNTISAAGTGTVTMYGAAVVSNSNGSDSKDQVVTASAMIGEKAAASINSIEATLLKVCGNPANTVVRLNSVAKNIIIWNNQGQVAASAKNTSELNVSHLPSGTYYLQTVSENNIHNTTAIVIQ